VGAHRCEETSLIIVVAAAFSIREKNAHGHSRFLAYVCGTIVSSLDPQENPRDGSPLSPHSYRRMAKLHRQIPNVRIVSGVAPIHQPISRRVSKALAPMKSGARTTAYYVAGLWPLLAMMGLAFALIWSAGMNASP